MNGAVSDPLEEFNQLYKTLDDIYHKYAKSRGLSDSALWLLYSLRSSSSAYTQSELCSAWHYPPQTLNSALKALEQRGMIALESMPGNRKNKRVALTAEGEDFARRVVDPLMSAERKAFRALDEGECMMLLSLMRKYTAILDGQVASIRG